MGNISGWPIASFVPVGNGTWRATAHTTGPWDERAQHGGPPSALLGRAIQRCAPRDDMIVTRFTCEILGAIPVGDLDVQARLVRPGRSVEFLEAVASAGGRDVARASAWRVLRTTSETVLPLSDPPPALPDRAVGAPAEAAGSTGTCPRSSGGRSAGTSASRGRPRSGPGCATPWSRTRRPAR